MRIAWTSTGSLETVDPMIRAKCLRRDSTGLLVTLGIVVWACFTSSSGWAKPRRREPAIPRPNVHTALLRLDYVQWGKCICPEHPEYCDERDSFFIRVAVGDTFAPRVVRDWSPEVRGSFLVLGIGDNGCVRILSPDGLYQGDLGGRQSWERDTIAVCPAGPQALRTPTADAGLDMDVSVTATLPTGAVLGQLDRPRPKHPAELGPTVLERHDPSIPVDYGGPVGLVKVEAWIDTSGNAHGFRVVQGITPDLDSLAVRAVRTWRFAPGFLCGGKFPMGLFVDISFEPRSR